MKSGYWIAPVVLVLILIVVGVASAQGAPAVITNAASDITTNSATLNGTLTGLGNASSVDVSFEWGLTDSYGDETTPQTMTDTGSFYDSIGSLDPGTTYHYRAKAVGNGTDYGGDATFTTGTTPPSVTTNDASGVTSDSAVLNGTLTGLGTDTSVDVSFEWGLTAGYGNETSPQAMPATGDFNALISGLDPGIIYYFRAKAVGDSTTYGDDMALTTLGQIELEGSAWCTSYGSLVGATLEGDVMMVERSHASNSYSLHVVGNLTLHLSNGSDETVALDLYGSRVRSLFYLRQEMTGKSASLSGSWIDVDGGNYYIYTSGTVALPNPDGEALKTAKLCFVMLRTPDVEVPLPEGGSFLEDVEAVVTRLTRLIDKVWDALIGTGFGELMSGILAQMAVLLAAVRDGFGGAYVP